MILPLLMLVSFGILIYYSSHSRYAPAADKIPLFLFGLSTLGLYPFVAVEYFGAQHKSLLIGTGIALAAAVAYLIAKGFREVV